MSRSVVKAVTMVASSVTVNEDLQKERLKCSFSVEELTNFHDGGAANTQLRRKYENIVLSNKEIKDDIPEEYLSHKEKYENAVRKSVAFYRMMPKVEKEIGNNKKVFTKVSYGASAATFKDNTPFSLHFVMFIPAIIGQGTKEQQEYWLKRARNLEIMGTYAQTELGHGTFIRGLETTATYDPKTEEFVIHSPSLSAYKWWPGGLAHTANYVVLMAQLYTNGKNCGIQPFVVQIRDEETHMPLPGIKVGEIGAKQGFNNVNNGFLGFENHRIPRDRMLMKNSQVLKDGTFVPSKNSKLTYGTMIFVRVTIVDSMANMMAKVATIAIRYSAVRRQSQLKPDQPEVQIMDFMTQMHKLFIVLASSFAYRRTADWLWKLYDTVTSDIEGGNLNDLPELHSLVCCLKAVSTSDSATFVERCRQACGGHGYMHSSNLPFTYGLATAACTYEGENTVLMLQTARSLVKAHDMYSNSKPVSHTLAYLFDKRGSEKWENSVDGIIAGFKAVAAGKLASCVDNINKLMKQGVAYEDAYNRTSVRLVSLSETHCRAFVMSTFRAEVERVTPTLSAPLAAVMEQLVELYAIYWALERVGDLLMYTMISEPDVAELQSQYEQLLLKIRPNAVGMVDAFDYRDEVLQSTLGAYDGRVYERLMEEALKSPLNAEPVNQSFHRHLKPFMQGKL